MSIKKCVDVLGYSKEEVYSDDFNFLNVIADEYKELTRENHSLNMNKALK